MVEWHTALDGCNSPRNDDYNDAAILNDHEWIRIVTLKPFRKSFFLNGCHPERSEEPYHR